MQADSTDPHPQTLTTSIVLASLDEANQITAAIKTAGENLSNLLLEAHDREVWRAKGYRSWSAYIEAEFDFNRSHSYRLLNQAKVNQKLEASGSPLRVTEREARDLSPTGDNFEIEREVETRRETPIARIRNGGDSFPTDSFDDGEPIYQCRHCQRTGTLEQMSRCMPVVRQAQSEYESA